MIKTLQLNTQDLRINRNSQAQGRDFPIVNCDRHLCDNFYTKKNAKVQLFNFAPLREVIYSPN